jgi:hypothetical protein
MHYEDGSRLPRFGQAGLSEVALRADGSKLIPIPFLIAPQHLSVPDVCGHLITEPQSRRSKYLHGVEQLYKGCRFIVVP